MSNIIQRLIVGAVGLVLFAIACWPLVLLLVVVHFALKWW